MKSFQIYLLIYVIILNVISVIGINFRNNACKDLLNYPVREFSGNCYENPDVGASTAEIIQRRGYKVESHFVTTDDGYVLQIVRIPPKTDDYRKNKQPIFLLHGILSDSTAWVFVGNRSIALSLAAEGYDVWMGNERGTRYSRQHMHLNDRDKQYWDYSMDTLAKYEIPAFLHKVATVTEKAGQIIFIGHSRAVMLLFMYAAENPQDTEQLLRGIVALAPTPYFDPSPGVRNFFKTAQSLGNKLEIVGFGALFQDPDTAIAATRILCPNFPHPCHLIAQQFLGETNLFLPEDLLNFFSHFPAPLTFREIEQHEQFLETDQFQKFDYGPEKNLQMYGQDKPPLYDLQKITVPVFIYFGKKDNFISQKTVNRILSEIASVRKAAFVVPLGNDQEQYQFSHVDYLFAKDLTNLFFKDMLQLLEGELQS